MLFQEFIHGLLTRKLDFKQLIGAFQHGGVDAAIKNQLRARLGRFGRANVRQRGVRIQHALNQGFNFASAGFLPKQPRAHHFGVVEHQHIACIDVGGQIGELFVGERRIRQRHQQAAAAARSGRVLRNQVLGKDEVKIRKLHGDLFEGKGKGRDYTRV